MSDSYSTIAGQHRAEIKIERSRFIASVCPVTGADEAAKFISAISKEYHDARHNCYAFRVGLGAAQVFKSSDDGEPSGTAGRQILDAIDKHQLTDTCLVVTRYFGGIKLGTGGLSRAYREAALRVVDEAGVDVRFVTEALQVVFPLACTNAVIRILSSDGCSIRDSAYSDIGSIKFAVRLSRKDSIIVTLVEATNGRALISNI